MHFRKRTAEAQPKGGQFSEKCSTQVRLQSRASSIPFASRKPSLIALY